GAHFVHQTAGWIAIDERLQFAHRLARFGLIALRREHLAEVREPELVLRLMGARVRRIEGEELAELVDGEDERLGGALAEIRVADTELGVRPERTRGVGFDDLLEELASRQPLLVVER